MGLSYNVYLNGDKIFGCKNCKTHLASHDAIISRNFRGQHGKAFLFNTVVNTTQSEAVERNMTTGRHQVRDVICKQCKETVGWKYDKAYEAAEKYKEGNSQCLQRIDEEQVAESRLLGSVTALFDFCALITENYKPKNLLAVDAVQSRLDLAKSLRAEPWIFRMDRGRLDKRVNELTECRGADVVIEVIGLSLTLKMVFELLRPWCMISSVGVHNGEIPWTKNQACGKNLRIQMGRCPVRSIFPQASEKPKQKQHLLGFTSDKIMPMSQAVEGYNLFGKMKLEKGKVIPFGIHGQRDDPTRCSDVRSKKIVKLDSQASGINIEGDVNKLSRTIEYITSQGVMSASKPDHWSVNARQAG
ncbi:MAG: hypothetical protein Q9181_001319 [Wetmoreana brouardii]